jgi:hypothetical protein
MILNPHVNLSYFKTQERPWGDKTAVEYQMEVKEPYESRYIPSREMDAFRPSPTPSHDSNESDNESQGYKRPHDAPSV